MSILQKYTTEETCMVAVTHNGINLAHVPSHLLTYEICMAAVESNGYALQHVPHYYRT